ncbi:hypothetical protein [Rhodanobacter sp. L36]|uniref:hypothetical protein n=1 Tax=Rhodanobacter sp. L36 TaxID=1747221 RepID=UPI00131ABDE1|nr:hypothetical protein [Rhodanobacter sp. L36]
MSDTIDLLESIGQNAALRHATPEELVEVLVDAQASEVFKAAVATGESALLFKEFGHKPMQLPHTQGPGHEEEEQDEDDDAPRPVNPDHDQPPLPG